MSYTVGRQVDLAEGVVGEAGHECWERIEMDVTRARDRTRRAVAEESE